MYTFYTVNDDGARLWVGSQLLIDDWNGHSAVTNSANITLIAGQKYDMKLEYYEGTYTAVIKLFWSGPNLPQQIIPFNQPLLIDTIVPGVPDAIASELGLTGPNAAAQSNAVTMAEQVFQTLNNPLSDDLNGTVTDVVIKNGADIAASLGQWQTEGSEIYAVDRRGYVEYAFSLSSPDVYRLEIDGREQNPYRDGTSVFDLQVYVDGEYVGRGTLEGTPLTYGKVHLYLPWLPPGNHTLRVFWDNAANVTWLRLKSIRFQRLGGPDANSNGIRDWVETRLHKICGVNPQTPTISYVSPACLEGRGGYLSMMNLEAALHNSSSTNIVAAPAPGQKLYANEVVVPLHVLDRWYADVPLWANTNTELSISYQNGGLVETQSIAWVAKNVLDGGDMTIRKGDSLLLTAYLTGATNGAVTMEIEGQQYNTIIDEPIAHEFTSNGTYLVTGTYIGDSGQQSGSITVKVIGHAFTTNPACWVGKTRDWDNYNVPTEAIFNPDARLLKLVQTETLTNDGRRASLLIDRNEPRRIVSRVSTNGAIMASVTGGGFRLYSDVETYVQVIQTYPDGSKLVETLMVLSPVPIGVSVEVRIIAGGITFDDGTTIKQLTGEDFDALGQYKIRFIKPASAQTSVCHTIKVSQDETTIGTR